MEDSELREAILQFIKKRYERRKKIPPLRIMFKHFKRQKLNSTRFYKIFPKGISEACTLAAVPIPKERISRTKRAMEILRAGKQVEEDLSEVEDEETREVLTKALEYEKRGERSRALLEARKREREAKLAALKGEAELDVRKIPAYLKALDSALSRRILEDLQGACKIEGISLEEGCVRSDEDFNIGRRRESWTFEDAIDVAVTHWAQMVRLDYAANKYADTTFDFLCSECGARFEYTGDPPFDTFKCPWCLRTVSYLCPVCKETWPEEYELHYEPKTNTLQRHACYSIFKVISPS